MRELQLARLFVIIGGLVVLALTTMLVGPYFINWGSWRADFEREASRILGREVSVRGEASARLLPFPSVTFTDVEVAGPTPGEPVMTVESFSMDAELAPLMRGEFLIFDMRLVRPAATLSLDGDGRIDWALRPSTPFDPRQISLEKLTITEGRATLRHQAGGREHALTEINAEMSASALTGPWRMDGSLRVDGMKTALNVSTGSVAEDGHMRIRVRAAPEPIALNLEADGSAILEGGALRYEGTFRMAERVAVPEGRTPSAPAYRLSGRFGLDHQKVDVPEFLLETGPLEDPYTAEGHASISMGAEPAFSIVADGAQLRLGAEGEAMQDGSMALAERLAAIREVLLDLPRPQMPGSVEVNLPAVVAGDTTVRDIKLSARPLDNGWAIDSLSAALPGRTQLEGEGTLVNTPEDFGFRGKMLLAISQPSGFATWLSRDVDESIRRLPSAGFSADVELTRERQSFENMELILGGARFEGRAVAESRGQADPSLELALEGGALDVDGLSAFASLFVSEQGVTRLADRDVDLAVKAGPVAVAGLTAERVDTALRLRDGVLEIDRLSLGGLEGSDISATGTLRGLGDQLEGSIDATLVAADAAPLLDVLAMRLPAIPLVSELSRNAARYPGLFADAELTAVAQLGGEAGTGASVELNGVAGGGTVALKLVTDDALSMEDSALDVTFTASNDEPAALLALLGLPALPLGVADAASVELSLAGRLSDGANASLAFTSEGTSARFDGSLARREGLISAEGRASLATDDLEPWLMTTAVSLPGMGFGLPAKLDADISLNEGLLVVSGLEGNLDGDNLAGDLNASIANGLVNLTGSVALDQIDLTLLLEPLFGADALDGDGEAWPRTPFATETSPAFTTDLELVADQVLLGGGESVQDARFSMKLDREGLRLSGIRGSYRGAALSGLGELRNNLGTALMTAQLRLDDATLERLFPGLGMAGVADLSGTLTANGKSVDGLVASLSGSGTASVKGLVVSGLNPDALPDLLARADMDGIDIDAARTAIFAPGMVGEGRFVAGDAELALTIAGGVLRSPPTRFEGDKAALIAEVLADLRTGSVEASGTLEYLAGPESVVGAEPVVRFASTGTLDERSVTFDTQPLAQFLTQRALEREQARVEAMQAQLLERQRLRREARYYAALADERARAEEEQRREEEAARQAEEEARLRAEEEARQAAAAAETDARQDAAPQDNTPPPVIERQPLPQPQSRAFDPDAISDLLRSLPQ